MICAHLADAGSPEPQSTAGCQDCLAAGLHDWVHLRECLTCGRVGCCDSSPRKHATAHFHDTGHPVIRSAESGEQWRWCYVDGMFA
ncbi:UBP-type zinc finger domain-containing protein [Streptomyces sp. NPDC092296]|uniref:UBP-type zinc finger domain-containing protein n=1 Tax=Streptomyces sp. NPDC092296 TaxID=3366012 RepID=UPI003825CDB2